jgi:hypothetical protein
MAVVWDVAPPNFYQTAWSYIPEDSHLHTRHHENLKSQLNNS